VHRRSTAERYLPLTSHIRRAESLEELLTLHRGAPTTFTYDLTTSRALAAHLTPNGAMELRDRANHVRLAIAPAVAWPSDRPDERAALTTRLARSGRGWTLRQSVDPSWLARHLAHGTVTVDPTIEIDPDLRDCFIESDTPTTNYCSQNIMSVGYDGVNDQRAMVQFDLSALPRNALILNADLGLTGEYHSTNALKQVGLYQLLRPWTNSTTWNRYDAMHAWGSPGAASSTDAATTPAAVLTLGNSTGFVDFYPTDLVQAWVNGSTPNCGVLIRDVTPNTTANEINFSTREFGGVTPELDILWAPRAGILDTYGFESQDVSDGSSLRVNVGSGNLLLESVDAPNLQVSTGPDDEEKASWHANSPVLAGARVFNSSLLEHGQFGLGGVLGSGTDVWIAQQLDGSWLLHGPSGYYMRLTSGADGRFHGPADMPATLEVLADGTRTVTLPNGDTLTLDQRSGESRAYLAIWTNRSAGSASYVRDGTTNLSATDPGNYQTTFETDPDPDKGISALATTDGEHDYTYDGYGKLLTAASPGTTATHYGYDSAGRLTSVQPPTGSTWTITYDTAGRAHEVIEHPASGTDKTTTYDYAEGITTAHYPGGSSMEFHVNPATARLDEVVSGSSPPNVSAAGTLATAGTLTPPNSYPLDIDLSDAQGVSQLVIRVDGEPELVEADPCGAATSCHLASAFVFDAASYAGGLHPVEVIATDSSGAQRVKRLIVTVAPDTGDVVDDPPVDPTGRLGDPARHPVQNRGRPGS